MKKLSLAMALVMILAVCASTLGMTAFAAYAADTVAVIGSTEYNDLQAAFDSYKSGDTITIVKDITSTKSFTVKGSGWVDGVEAFKTDKPLTIDGNGKSITVNLPKQGDYALNFEGANVVVKNLTVNAKFDGVKLLGTAHVILKDCNVYAANTKAGEHVEGDWAQTATALKIDQNTKAYAEIDGGNYKSSGKATTNAENGKVTYTGHTFIAIPFYFHFSPNLLSIYFQFTFTILSYPNPQYLSSVFLFEEYKKFHKLS